MLPKLRNIFKYRRIAPVLFFKDAGLLVVVGRRTQNRKYTHQDKAEALGIRIRNLRRERGLTQRNLAFDADIDESTVLRIEKGRLIITVDLLFVLAEALGIQPKELFDFDEAVKKP